MIELTNSECYSIRECQTRRDIILNESLEIVKEIPATRHYRGRVIRYRIPKNWYSVEFYVSNRGKVYITPKYPDKILEDTYKTIREIILKRYGYDDVWGVNCD